MFLNNYYDNRIIAKKSIIVDKILNLDAKYRNLTNAELQNMTTKFKMRLASNESLDDIIIEAYATVKEAIFRLSGKTLYREQLLSALVLHDGDIAEMKTGEGKTLTAILAVYLNALSGKGVHVITSNEYLAERDARDNGLIYQFLGLTVGLNTKELNRYDKRKAFACDITYSTASELAFDYLRDNMVFKYSDKVLRGLNYILIDEADAILLDDAKTPLIIADQSTSINNLYEKANNFVLSLSRDDYELDEVLKTVYLNNSGILKAEKYFDIENLYTLENHELSHRITQALKAHHIMKKDIDYIVDKTKNEVIIIDISTGRRALGRAFCDGLHQAIEAKEKLDINNETAISATITYPNFFRLYQKIAGMTGTAKINEEELLLTYNMRVVQIPTHKKILRQDLNDKLYSTKKAKMEAIVSKVSTIHQSGQPILIGTADIQNSKELSQMLELKGIKHQVLNAENDFEEARIIAKAGQKWAVTIATNMAGRGTDIKFGEGVKELGGLAVLASERFCSKRVDDQLIGRSGRQGDPGLSQFFLSLEDDIILKYPDFSSVQVQNRLKKALISPKYAHKIITEAQEIIEKNDSAIRLDALKFDDILQQQRLLIYQTRDEALINNPHTVISNYFKKYAEHFVFANYQDLINTVKSIETNYLKENDLAINTQEEAIELLYQKIKNEYEAKISNLDNYIQDIERKIVLMIIDKFWTNHLNNIESLKKTINLRSYGQLDPFQEFLTGATYLFEQLQYDIAKKISEFALNIKVIEK